MYTDQLKWSEIVRILEIITISQPSHDAILHKRVIGRLYQHDYALWYSML